MSQVSKNAVREYADEISSELKADAEAAAAPRLETVSAQTLQNTNLPPVQFSVEGLIPHGLTVLGAPPKYGKSWLMLDLGLCVAAGRKFLGFTTVQSGVLYLALEDSHNRLKSRMEKLLDGRQAPADFDFAIKAPTLDNGLLAMLGEYLANNPGCKLVIIDTLAKVRGAPTGKENAYSADYRELGAFKDFADTHSVAVLFVHHLRKMQSEDPFERLNGSNGVFGSADAGIVMSREKRTDDVTQFTVSGRDVDGMELMLQFSKDTCKWENLGGLDWYTEQRARQDYHDSPVVQHIKALLRQSPEGWTGSGSEFLEGARIPLTPQGLNKEIKKISYQLLEIDGISYVPIRNGSGGTRHKFVFVNELR